MKNQNQSQKKNIKVIFNNKETYEIDMNDFVRANYKVNVNFK